MRYGCQINALSKLYNSLDDDFKSVINETIASEGNACSLLRLLKVWEGKDVDILSVVLEGALEKYEEIDERISYFGFCFIEVRLNITLEDVLYLTGLPIMDKPVITDYNRNVDAFKELFNVDDLNTIKMPKLFYIVRDKSGTTEKRIIVILLAIIECFVI